MRFFNALRIALLVTCVAWAGPSFAQGKSQAGDKSSESQSGTSKPNPPKSSADAATQKPLAAGKAESGSQKGQPDKQAAAAATGTPTGSESKGGLDSKGALPAEAKQTATAPAASAGTPAAAGPGAAPPSGAGAADAGQVDGSTYVVRMRDLAQRIDELKEQIRRSHTRLSLLSETILSGGAGGARAEVSFTNEMSSAFRLVRALFVLDGAVQYNKQDDTGGLAEQKTIPIFSGSIPPGDHTLQVLIKLQGYGYGVFSYLRGYKFEVKSTHSFTVTEGKTMRIEAIAWEKGGVTTPLEQRPAIRYVQKVGAEPTSRPEPTPATGASHSIKAGASVGTGGQ